MMLAERVMDRVAAAMLRDPLDVRLANLYGENERGITPTACGWRTTSCPS